MLRCLLPLLLLGSCLTSPLRVGSLVSVRDSARATIAQARAQPEKRTIVVSLDQREYLVPASGLVLDSRDSGVQGIFDVVWEGNGAILHSTVPVEGWSRSRSGVWSAPAPSEVLSNWNSN